MMSVWMRILAGLRLSWPRQADRAFDVVVVGSGASGGWAAKRLAEAGLRVAVLEAGRSLTDADYREHVPAFELPYRATSKAPLARERPVQSQSYAVREWNSSWFVNDLDEPYVDKSDPRFVWVRPRIVGGRTNVWGRESLRISDFEFKAASNDGAGVDWPIAYADLEPYYDLVEEYIGVQGMAEGLAGLPDGRFQPPMAMTCAEVALRTRIRKTFGRSITLSTRATARPAREVRHAHRRAGRRMGWRCDRASSGANPPRIHRRRHHARESRELLRPHAASIRGVLWKAGAPTLRAANPSRTSTDAFHRSNGRRCRRRAPGRSSHRS